MSLSCDEICAAGMCVCVFVSKGIDFLEVKLTDKSEIVLSKCSFTYFSWKGRKKINLLTDKASGTTLLRSMPLHFDPIMYFGLFLKPF